MTIQQLLLIDDDQRLSGMVSEYLARSGYSVERAFEGATGLGALKRNKFDLVILDLMLPDMDGLELCRQIRAQAPTAETATPVLILTAKGDPMDRIIGLELGADDYMTKPFEPRELLARVRTLLRRQDGGDVAPARTMRFGSMEIDLGARRVTIRGKPIDLTSYQFDMLLVLAEHAGRVLTRDQLIKLVCGRDSEPYDRSVDVHIARLRTAIEFDPKNPQRIQTVRSTGYIFVKHQN
ncbi:MAG: response regulator transcription factor [Burkholderiaceae bacterium]|jgi:DNA-binding response OmpR family regulator|nr:response regulator transcription factor [Burkholderiaceae bacterium]